MSIILRRRHAPPPGVPNADAIVVASVLKGQTIVGYGVDGRGLELHFDGGSSLLIHPYAPLTLTTPDG